MTRELRLQDLHVRQLQYLFSPPGLPLVRKGGDEGDLTTTILVRGEAGAGKTTLALALAHGIAANREGALLVLSSETSPIEYDFKAELVRIEQPRALAWDARAKAAPGSMIVQHIALTREPGDDDVVEERPSLLDVVWDMIRTYSEEEHETKIAAVLIDGVLLADESTATRRSETAVFLQALEARGISTVLVEESSSLQVSWLPFVVDVVFELQYEMDASTHKLTRQLLCRKSRYALAAAGPHEYDLDDDDVLAVWPDPLGLRPQDLLALGPDTHATIFRPVNTSPFCWVWRGGGLVCSHTGEAWDVVQTLGETRGNFIFGVFPADSVVSGVPERGGAPALVWRVIRAAREQGANGVQIHGLAALIHRASSPQSVYRALLALTKAGYLVGIRGTAEELTSVAHLTHFGPAQVMLRGLCEMENRRLAGVERWLVDIHGRNLSGVLQAHGAAGFRVPVEQWQRVQMVLERREEDVLPEAPEVEAVGRFLREIQNRWEPAVGVAALACARWLNRVQPTFTDLPDPPGAQTDVVFGHLLAVASHLIGRDWQAARVLVRTGPKSPVGMELWHGLAALYAGTPIDGPVADSDLHRILRARLLAAQKDFSSTETMIASCSDLSPWVRRRWLAELMAQYGTTGQWQRARAEFEALAADPGGPRLQRAEVLCNLARIAEGQWQPEKVVEALDQAVALNPLLAPDVREMRELADLTSARGP